MLKRNLLAILLILLFAATAAFAGNGTLTVAQRQDPGNWDPIDTFLVAWSSAGGGLFDGLVLRDERLKLQPGLAEKWEVLEDGMRLRFFLRKNVSFHNGEPFNAQAVKYTFDRLLGEEGKASPQRSNYTTIDHIEIVDDHTVDLVMNTPDPVMLTKLAGYGAMIVPPKYIEEKGSDYFETHPVGTGPFKFKSYTHSDRLELVANPDYFGGAPKLAALTYRFIREDATRLAELQSGRVDVLHDIAFSQLPIVEKTKGVNIVSVPGPTIYSLQFNTKNGITKDVRVRKALSMAVDKQAIINAFLAGHGKPIATVQGELSFGFDPALKDYPYDPDQAKKLLTEANIKPGTTVTIDYRAKNSAFAEVVQAISGFFSAVGINTKLQPIEDGVFLNEVVPQGKTSELFQFSWGGWTFDFDNTAYLIYHSGERWNPYGTTAEMDQLLEKQRRSINQQERLQLLRDVARLAHQNVYHLPLYNQDTLYAVSDRVVGFVPAPDNRVRYLTTSVK